MKIGKLNFSLNNSKEDIKVDKEDMLNEQASPSPVSVRQPYMSDEVASTLTPNKYADIVRAVKLGDAYSYLTLAEEMEERDLHYRSVLGSRKNAISSLVNLIQPASDDEKDKEIADDVYNTIVRNPAFDNLVSDLLDAIGKGYSVCEINWELSSSKWYPKSYTWKDPRWFKYDDETGRQLMLLEGAEAIPLKPYKFIIHEPHLKSGLQLRSGLALPCSFYHLIKSYDVSSWSAFAEVFGYPLRIGKYGRNSSKRDREVLKSAIRNIGRDVGAIIPENMAIEIINAAKNTGNITLYEKLAEWVDKQISKAVVGQTMSSDAEGGQYKGELHNEIRLEIKESDANQLAATINRDLIIPYVQLNYGILENYPNLKIPVPKPENIEQLTSSISQLVPLGLKVKTDDLYSKLGLTRPDKDDEILQPETIEKTVNTNSSKVTLNSEENKPILKDDVDNLVDETLEEWEELNPYKEKVLNLINSCKSYEELIEKLPGALEEISTKEDVINLLTTMFFKAKALGDSQAIEED